MSEQDTQTNGEPQAVEMECPGCHHKMPVARPSYDIINGGFHSVIIVPHQMIGCEECGAVYNWVINPQGTQVNIDLMCVKEAERKILIATPTNFKGLNKGQ